MIAKLLIVDDEVEIQNMLSNHFGFMGHDVYTASNGKDALEKMEKERFEVVISDIMMPVMDGIDMLREIKHNYPMTHVIMITGYVTMDNVLACMRLGADTCVFKPLDDMKELEGAVDNAIKSLSNWQKKMKMLKGMKPEV